jgi:hypothetical protein
MTMDLQSDLEGGLKGNSEVGVIDNRSERPGTYGIMVCDCLKIDTVGNKK